MSAKITDAPPTDQTEHIQKAFVLFPTKLLAEVGAKQLSAPACVLYGLLRFWQGTNSELWYGIPSIAEHMGLSQSTVKRLLEELKDAGHISRTRRMGANWRTKCLTYVKDNRVVCAGVRQEQIKRHRPRKRAGDPVNPENAADKGAQPTKSANDALCSTDVRVTAEQSQGLSHSWADQPLAVRQD